MAPMGVSALTAKLDEAMEAGAAFVAGMIDPTRHSALDPITMHRELRAAIIAFGEAVVQATPHTLLNCIHCRTITELEELR